MAYFGIVTGVNADRQAVRIDWALNYEELVDSVMTVTESSSQAQIVVPIRLPGTRAAILAEIRSRVAAEVRPVVDRANALKPAVDSHLAALRTALVGERYPEA